MSDVSQPPRPARAHIVAIGGASRVAFEQIVRAAPAQVGRCYVVLFVGLGDILPALRRAATLPVTLIEHGTVPQADRIYVAPTGADVIYANGAFELVPPTAPAVPLDRLFRSLADEAGPETTCIVLSGSTGDGAIGLKRVKECDGFTIAQAPDDAEDPRGPMAAIETGLVDIVLPASEIGGRIAAPMPIETEILDDEHRRRDAAADALRDILTLVRVRTGHDFSQYKRPTLYRRVARRMQVCGRATLADYHRHLREYPSELEHLLRDFLISVTNFFRDQDAFEALARLAVPALFANRTAGDQVRVWVAGCASGEEVYSIGMLLLEYADRLASPPAVQIFATDIDEAALAEARAGRYSEAAAADISAERRARFFVHEAQEYRVNKELREIVLFSPHNLLRDPPFSRLDLVSCRNVLIYLNREAQDRVLSMFHFGLRPEGNLFLGSSESAEAAALRFGPVDAKARIFTRRTVPVGLVVPALAANARWQPRPTTVPAPAERTASSFGDVHHRVVEFYAPPSVLVDEELEVLHMSEHAGRFLQFAGGEPTRQLFRLVHPSLRVELRSLIYAMRQSKTALETRDVRVESEDGAPRTVQIRLRTVVMPDVGTGLLLVMFDELEERSDGERLDVDARGPALASANEPVVRELEDDLQRTRDHLRTSVEQYETSLEELKASNEELQAINEELRSATEELETSKEELQSVNEELTTLNHELKMKIDEVSRANSDLQNLMASTDLAVLFLDRKLNIKRFTARSVDLFNLIESDAGRPLSHLTHRLAVDDLDGIARQVLQHLRVVEREVLTDDGEPYLLRALPYRSLEDRIEGVVFTFVDIGKTRRAEAALLASDARFRLALSAAPAVATTHDAAGTCTWAFVVGKEVPARRAWRRSCRGRTRTRSPPSRPRPAATAVASERSSRSTSTTKRGSSTCTSSRSWRTGSSPGSSRSATTSPPASKPRPRCARSTAVRTSSSRRCRTSSATPSRRCAWRWTCKSSRLTTPNSSSARAPSWIARSTS